MDKLIVAESDWEKVQTALQAKDENKRFDAMIMKSKRFTAGRIVAGAVDAIMAVAPVDDLDDAAIDALLSKAKLKPHLDR